MDKADLGRYRALSAEVRQLKDRLRTTEAALRSPGGQRFSRTPAGPADGGRTMEALVARHGRLLDLYEQKILELHDMLITMEMAVEQLPDPAERMVLRYRYMDGYDWQRIAREMRYSVRSIYRIHGYALLHLRAE